LDAKDETIHRCKRVGLEIQVLNQNYCESENENEERCFNVRDYFMADNCDQGLT
jgi:hypothetical protein